MIALLTASRLAKQSPRSDSQRCSAGFSSGLYTRIKGFDTADLGVGLGADAQHRHRVAHRHKTIEHHTEDALRRRIGGQQFGVHGLNGLQFLEQPVVLGIWNCRRVEHVVAVSVGLQLPAQFEGARCRVNSLFRHGWIVAGSSRTQGASVSREWLDQVIS